MNLDKVHEEYNVVIPPSVDEVYFSHEVCRYSLFWEDLDNDIITFNVAKHKRDEIVGFMANELRFKDIAKVDDDGVLCLYDLNVECY